MKADVLLHDDACHFQASVRGERAFKDVKRFLVDRFHQKNHKCSKREWKPAEQKRMRIHTLFGFILPPPFRVNP